MAASFQSPLRLFQDDDPNLTAKTIKGYEGINKRLNYLLSDFDLTRTKGTEGASAFEAALAAATPEATKVSGERSQGFRDLIAGARSYDPFNEYKKVGDYWRDAAQELRGGILEDTRAADARRRMALGLTSPGSNSGYAQRAATAGIQGGMQPFYERILANSGDIFSRLYGARQGERGAALGLYDQLALEPDRLAYRSLLPAQVYKANLADMTQALTPLEKLKEAITYMYRPKSTLEKVADFQESNTNSIVDLGMQAASMYFGGGAGGVAGMAGGMMGGMGGGGGGGSGGLTIQQIMQMIYGNRGGNIGSDIAPSIGGHLGGGATDYNYGQPPPSWFGDS